MKTIKFIVVGIMLFFAVSAQAQISVRINLGSPPQWGPAGYDDVRYYYLPDVEAYYDVPSSMFIYYNGISWIHRSYLPSRYRNYDLYNGYKVPMSNYRGDRPYNSFRQHKMQYARGYRGQEQHNIGERPQKGNPNEGNYSRGKTSSRNNHEYVQGNRRGNDKYKGRGNDRGKKSRKND
jgi:hypothetical protein